MPAISKFEIFNLCSPINELTLPNCPGLSGSEIHKVVLYFLIRSSFFSPLSCQYLRIAALAFPVFVTGIQCKDGDWFLEVIILTLSPFLKIVCNSDLFPLISQPIAVLPILVCTAYAKSIGVAFLGNLITEPLGVKQKHFLGTFEALYIHMSALDFHFFQ